MGDHDNVHKMPRCHNRVRQPSGKMVFNGGFRPVQICTPFCSEVTVISSCMPCNELFSQTTCSADKNRAIKFGSLALALLWLMCCDQPGSSFLPWAQRDGYSRILPSS